MKRFVSLISPILKMPFLISTCGAGGSVKPGVQPQETRVIDIQAREGGRQSVAINQYLSPTSWAWSFNLTLPWGLHPRLYAAARLRGLRIFFTLRIAGLIICFFFAGSNIFAQTPPENSPPATGQSRVFTIEEMNNRAASYLRQDRNEEAYLLAKRALVRSQQRGNNARASRSANLTGIAAFRLGRISEAIEFYKQAFSVVAEAKDDPEAHRFQLAALSRAASLLRLSGRYEEALWCFNQALQLYRKQNDRAGESLMLSRMSIVFAFTGDAENAAIHSAEALKLAKLVGDRAIEENALLSYLLAHEQQGNYQSALEYGLQEIELIRAFPLNSKNPGYNFKELRYVRLTTLYHVATTYAALRQFQPAVDFFERALNYANTIHSQEVFILGDYAWTQLQSGKPEQALASASQAITSLQKLGGNKHLESRFRATMAAAQRALGRTDEALNSYRQAVAAVEEARLLSIPTEISRAGIIASRHDVFTGAINFMLEQNLTSEALAIAESYHARVLLDVLAEAGDGDKDEFTPEQKSDSDRILAKISGIQRELWKPEIFPTSEKIYSDQLAQAEQELEMLRIKIRRANPRYAAVKYPNPLKPETIAKEIIPPDTAFIEFVLGEQKSVAFIMWQGRLSSIALPSAKEIEKLVAQYNETFSGKVYSLTALQSIAQQKKLGQQAYQTLFQTIEPQISGAKKLIIVPDGALAYLPFETLVDHSASPNYLIERFAISYAPSASALAQIRSHKKNNNSPAAGIIAFGDPLYGIPNALTRGSELRQLPSTRTEVNEISALFPVAQRKIFLGIEANEKTAKAEALQQYKYLHFAAHGNVDEAHPARSGIILSRLSDPNEDGTLQVSEVMQLKLNADLVTLSACRTGLGKLLHGEGMIGLTRAFIYAGANSVVVSLWNVNDVATASLMKSFYQNLQSGMPKAEALRQAKLELLTGEKRAWRHPYYWAPFVLIGEN